MIAKCKKEEVNKEQIANTPFESVTPGKVEGVIKVWHKDKNFGYIQTLDGGEDVYCHESEVLLNAGDTPLIGARVEFKVVEDRKVSQARDVCAIGGGCCIGEPEHEPMIEAEDVTKDLQKPTPGKISGVISHWRHGLLIQRYALSNT